MASLLSPEIFSEFFSSTTLLIFAFTILLGIAFVYNSFWNVERWGKYGVKHMDLGIMELTDMAKVALKGNLDTVGTRRGNLVLFTRDLELIKKITVRDFTSFYNHPEILATKSPLGQGLFFLRDQQWKKVRQLMSPSFSTGKLKGMSKVMQKCAMRLANVMEEHAREEKLFRLYHFVGQYTSSIIARTAFGIDTDTSIGQEVDDQFTHCAKNIFQNSPNVWRRYLVVILLFFPRIHRFLTQKLGIALVDVCDLDSRDYLSAVLEKVIADRDLAHRNGKGKDYGDFLQGLIAAKVARDVQAEKGTSSSEATGPTNGDASGTRTEKTLTHEEVLAQAYVILIAGFETTASALQFCLYQLALNHDIQDKVYAEIQNVVHSEQVTHEEIHELHYMDQVINESMRLNPSVGVIGREANETRTYGDITIPAGSTVFLPITDIHRDPKNFPDPETFDPERFSEEEKAKRDPFAFVPFGWGQRLCIGSRLSLQEMKIALVHILRKVSVDINERTVPKKGERIKVVYNELPKVLPPIQLQVNFRRG